MVGTVTVSLELELGWGVARHGLLDKVSEGRRAETRTLHRLLDRCDDLGVPITVNVVGHLLLSECAGTHEGPYAPGWFDVDPGTSREEDPRFYAPDLVAAIRDAEVDHEICTHTFSHVECGKASPEVVGHDLDEARRLHHREGLGDVVSLVPPRHSPPPRDVLRDRGIEIVRTPADRAAGGRPGRSGPGRLYEIALEGQPVLPPRMVDGVVETYSPAHKTLAAEYLPCGTHGSHPAYRWLPVAARRRLHRWNHRLAIRRAIEADAFVHLWSHLYDISNAYQWPQIESFLEALARHRDRGDLRILTMAAVNDVVRGRTDDGRADDGSTDDDPGTDDRVADDRGTDDREPPAEPRPTRSTES